MAASSDTDAQKRRLVAPALVVAVSAIAFAAIFFRLAAPTPPLVAAGVRLAIAAAVLLPATIRARLRGRLDGRLLRAAVVAGLLYGVHFGAWVASLGLTSVAASVTIVTATPLLLAVWSLFTGADRPDRRSWAALGLGVAGVAIIGASHEGGRDALLGDALAALGAAAMAGYLLVGRRLGHALDVLPFAGVATGTGAVALLGTAALLGQSPVPPTWEAAGYLALAALVPQLIGHNLLTWSLRWATPTAVGVATLGEPVGATALGWLWLGEAAPPLVLVGCGVTLSGVLLSLLRVSGAPAAARRATRAGGRPTGR